MAGWQFDIAFDPAALEAINVTEGDFLKMTVGAPSFRVGLLITQWGKSQESALYDCPLKV